MPYEKVGKNEPVCITDEVPFDIPDSWEWARLKDLTIKEIKRGKSPKYADDGNVYVFAQKCNVKLGGIDISLAKFLDMKTFDKYPVEEYMADGDIIINSTGNGTLGRIGIFRDSDRINDFVIVPDSHVTIIRAGNQMIKDYLFFALKYHQPYLEKLGEGSTNQTELRPSTVAELFIPVPPIGEQERIVAKLQEVLPMADVYGLKEKSLQDYNKDFPVQLKKSILQEAVQGKLVPQDPDDEPASVLLERIRAEKEQLIKAGKIKRDKHESVIFRRDNSHYEKLDGIERCIDDELPFEIPDSWEWVTLNMIAESGLGKTLNRTKDTGILKPYLCSINVYWEGIDLSTIKEALLTDSDLTKYRLNKGDLLICEGGDVGRSAVWEKDEEMYYQNALHRVRFYGNINPYYFHLVMQCYKGNMIIDNKSKGVTIKHLVQASLNSIYFPLPPLSEQQRIVGKQRELFEKITLI